MQEFLSRFILTMIINATYTFLSKIGLYFKAVIMCKFLEECIFQSKNVICICKKKHETRSVNDVHS